METKWYYYIIVCVAGYLVGSVNFAKIFSKLKSKDISKMGSGNPGTMNMIRSVGIGMGVATLAADILKAVAVCLLAYFMCGDLGLYSAGLCVVLGHNYSVFLGFKGGKGVACAIGVFAVANPIATLVAFALLIAYLFIFKYGSIGSFLLIIGLSVTECIIHRADPAVVVVVLEIAVLILFAHRGNIARLCRGQENKLELVKYIKAAKAKKALKSTDTATPQDVENASKTDETTEKPIEIAEKTAENEPKSDEKAAKSAENDVKNGEKSGKTLKNDAPAQTHTIEKEVADEGTDSQK